MMRSPSSASATSSARRRSGGITMPSTSSAARPSTRQGLPDSCATSARKCPGPCSTTRCSCPSALRRVTRTSPASTITMPRPVSPMRNIHSPRRHRDTVPKRLMRSISLSVRRGNIWCARVSSGENGALSSAATGAAAGVGTTFGFGFSIGSRALQGTTWGMLCPYSPFGVVLMRDLRVENQLHAKMPRRPTMPPPTTLSPAMGTSRPFPQLPRAWWRRGRRTRSASRPRNRRTARHRARR